MAFKYHNAYIHNDIMQSNCIALKTLCASSLHSFSCTPQAPAFTSISTISKILPFPCDTYLESYSVYFFLIFFSKWYAFK